MFFSLNLKKKNILKSFLVPLSLSEKLAQSFPLKEAKSSPDCKMTEPLTFDIKLVSATTTLSRAKTRTK